jgi:hypothetical protein
MRKITLLKIMLGFTAVEGLIALIWQLRIPSDPKNAWILGFSIERMAMLVTVILGVALLIFLFIRMLMDEKWGLKFIGNVQIILSKLSVFDLIMAISGLIVVVGAYISLLFLNELTDDLWQARLLRLIPIILWGTLISFQVFILTPLLKGRQSRLEFSFHLDRDVWRATGIVLIPMFVFISFVSITRIGLDPIGDWETIGVPISFMQIIVAFFTAVAGLLLGKQLLRVLPKWFAGYWKDILIAVIIWVVAIWAWQSVPMKPTFNAPRPGPPNFEYYPHSGAAFQDVVAQNLIIGEGYKLDEENEKPFYALFLAGLHIIKGQDYEQVVNLQILATAIFPVVLFFFGKVSLNRFTGLMLAILAIMRERNALILMSQFDISHSKLLLTDMPGTMILSIFILITFLWLLRYPRNRAMAFFSGCLMGLSMLIRNQTLVLILVVAITLFVLLRREWKVFFRGMLIFSLGVLLVVTPWLYRNYQVTGRLFTVLPEKGKAVVQRFRMDDGLVPRYDDLTTMGEGLERLFEFSLEHPVEMAEFLTAHYLHNEISTILTLPVSFTSCCSISSYVEDNPYWGSWDGEGVSDAIVPVMINIFLATIGLGVAWKTHRFLGLFPLFIHLLHNLSSIVWGISGWRFILPVDWIGVFYYCIGLVYLAFLAFTFYTGKVNHGLEPRAVQGDSFQVFKKPIWILTALVLVIGFFIPVAEHIFPQKYERLSKSVAVSLLEDSLSQSDGADRVNPSDLISDPSIEAYMGRGLYPRFYRAGKGEPGTSYRWPAHTARDYDRLGFYLAGPDNWSVVLPLGETPQHFPNAQVVLVFGCQVENYLIAQVVLLLDSSKAIYTSALPCSYFDH